MPISDFSFLYRNSYPYLYRLVASIAHNSSLIEDILQETMYDLPMLEDVGKCVVTLEAAKREASPEMITTDIPKSVRLAAVQPKKAKRKRRATGGESA